MSTNKNGGVPGVITPENDEGIVTGQGNNPQNDSTNSSNSARHGPIDQAPDSKVVADQIARLTRAGHVVHQSHLGDFLVTKYGLTRYCAGFDELEAFAQKVGVN